MTRFIQNIFKNDILFRKSLNSDFFLKKILFFHPRYFGYASTIGNTFENISIKSDFSVLNMQDYIHFHSIVGDEGLISDFESYKKNSEGIEKYNSDWTGKYKGNSRVVLLPKCTLEVSEIMKYCNHRNLAVVPQGGNTGLVGGSIPIFDEIILSLSRMRKIINFDPISGILSCESGCVLGDLEKWVDDNHNHIMPIDLASQGSCQIGGNISTNAGGIRVVRYGTLRGSVVGIRAVLADGSIMNEMSGLIKNNTGYHLPSLLIGSEGTLGIVTEVSLICPSKPIAKNLVFLECKSFKNLCLTFVKAREKLSEILSAVEFLDKECLELVVKQMDGNVKHPLEDNMVIPERECDKNNGESPFYLLIETSGSVDSHDKEKLEIFLEEVMKDSHQLVTNGIVAQNDDQIKQIWFIREMQAIAQLDFSRGGSCFFYDISAPPEILYDIVNKIRDHIKDDLPDVYVLGFGHLADGNIHISILSEKKKDQQILDLIEPFIFEITADYGGSISAEHGIGIMKVNEINYNKDKISLSLMKNLKNTFDPKGILNPYKLLPR